MYVYLYVGIKNVCHDYFQTKNTFLIIMHIYSQRFFSVQIFILCFLCIE